MDTPDPLLTSIIAIISYKNVTVTVRQRPSAGDVSDEEQTMSEDRGQQLHRWF